MTHPLPMAVPHSFQNFAEIPSCHSLRQFFLLSQQASQTLLSRILHHKVQFPVLSCQKVQLHHTLTIQGLQMPHLSLDTCQPVPVETVQLVVGLHCITLLPVSTDSHRYYRKCTLSDMRHQFQVLQALGR